MSPTPTAPPAPGHITGVSRSREGDLPSRPESILVADDEHLVASAIAANLRELGHRVIGPVSSGEEAISLCESARPDMALLDIRMPGQDGIAAAAAIFERFDIPAMILSAYADPEYACGASGHGVFGYLLKPVTPDQLRVAIAVAWARYVDASGQAAEIASLKERLEQRKTIEQAKWIVVKRKGVDEPEAMRLLQRHARNNRRTLIDVARAVLENEDLFG